MYSNNNNNNNNKRGLNQKKKGQTEGAWERELEEREEKMILERETDRTLPRPYLNSCLKDPLGHFNGLLETNSSDRRNPRSEPSLSITGLLV